MTNGPEAIAAWGGGLLATGGQSKGNDCCGCNGSSGSEGAVRVVLSSSCTVGMGSDRTIGLGARSEGGDDGEAEGLSLLVSGG